MSSKSIAKQRLKRNDGGKGQRSRLRNGEKQKRSNTAGREIAQGRQRDGNKVEFSEVTYTGGRMSTDSHSASSLRIIVASSLN